MHMMVLIIITTMIIIWQMVNPEATDLLTVKAVADNFGASIQEVEAKDPSIIPNTNDNSRTKGIRK